MGFTRFVEYRSKAHELWGMGDLDCQGNAMYSQVLMILIQGAVVTHHTCTCMYVQYCMDVQ